MTVVAQAAASVALQLAALAVLVGPVWWLARHRELDRATTIATSSSGSGGVAVVTTTRPSVRTLGVAAAIFLAITVVYLVPNVGPFADLVWNWQGKLAVFALGLLLVACWRGGPDWREVGVVLPSAHAWWPIAPIALGLLALNVVVGAILHAVGAPLEGPSSGLEAQSLTEALWFQATVPGLDEELLFRGILWALVARALPGQLGTFRGAPVGWALIVTTVLFALVHGLLVDEHLAVTFHAPAIVVSAIVGFALGWVRARWGSILPAIVLHNVYNVGITLLTGA